MKKKTLAKIMKVALFELGQVHNIDVSKVRLTVNKSNFYGYFDNSYEIGVTLININPNISLEKQLGTLCHEFRHLMQFVNDGLMWKDNRTVYYKGEKYDDIAYENQPWEIDAEAFAKKEIWALIEILQNRNLIVDFQIDL